ncbi:MAG: DNA polymerase III subunit delta', partial [Myxococcota bacterium]
MTPQTLSEIIGQDEAVRHLTKLATDGRMPHAMLFVGPDSVGKFTAAQLLARGLLCHNPPSPGDACGVCSACTKVMSGNHADLHLITTDQRQI